MIGDIKTIMLSQTSANVKMMSSLVGGAGIVEVHFEVYECVEERTTFSQKYDDCVQSRQQLVSKSQLAGEPPFLELVPPCFLQ